MLNLSNFFEGIIWLNGAIPRVFWRNGRAFDPVYLLIEVTYHCNLRCNFCQYLDIIKGEVKTIGPVREYKTEEIKKTIDEFPNHRLISFSGGETLVRKDFPEIIRYASRKHRTHIVTNGALVSEDVARLYVDLAPRYIWNNGLVLIGVSMEGDEALHDEVVGRPGSWKQTVAGIRHLVRLRKESGKKYPKLNLKMAVTKDTVHGMADFMYLAKDLGMDLVNFLTEQDLIGHSGTLVGPGDPNRIHVEQKPPEGVDPEFLRKQLIRCFELEKELGLQIRTTPPNLPIDEFVRHYTPDRQLTPDEYICEGAWARVGQTAEGRYSICPYLRTGNSREQSLGEIWNGDAFREFRRTITRDKIYAGCNGCCNQKYIGPKKYGLAGVNGRPSTG